MTTPAETAASTRRRVAAQREADLTGGRPGASLVRLVWSAFPIKWGRRVILTERSEVGGESRRKPAVTGRAGGRGAAHEPRLSWPSTRLPCGALVPGLTVRSLHADCDEGYATLWSWCHAAPFRARAWVSSEAEVSG